MFGRPKIITEKKVIGKNVKFGKNVVIRGFKNQPLKSLYIGDNCVFHDNVKIVVSPWCYIGSGNVFHAGVHIVGDNEFIMRDFNWVGERTFLDSTGKLYIGDGNTIGLNCMIWSHVIRPQSTYTENPTPEIDMRLPTVIENDCWLMGGNIQISPGVILRTGTIILANSVVTITTDKGDEQNVFGGVPAGPIEVTKWKRKK